MGIKLFEYNQTAYKAALNLMKQNGKAAVIHPTGTGKSFIGFKLCEDFPEASVCWLSPSEYIFKTQTENLKKRQTDLYRRISSFTHMQSL